MSFSTEIKNELARIMPEKECCQLAEIFKDSFRLEVSCSEIGGRLLYKVIAGLTEEAEVEMVL